jgi:aryl-alcohol dehydrogenase-like predicted oxidoreductase
VSASFAAREGTAGYAARFPQYQETGFYRTAQDLTISSIGLGTYLGDMNEATDRGYTEATMVALRGGINFLDTSLNYRHQRSERALGAAIKSLFEAGELRRDEFAVCTKAGYLVPGAIPSEKLSAEEIVSGSHSLAPAFLVDQLERSIENLGLEGVDVFYLHNPESQLEAVSHSDVYRRIRAAFEELERQVQAGRIRFYGTATWDAYRTRDASADGLALTRLVEIARGIAGEQHHFRFIQLPLNVAMTEAMSLAREQLDGRRVTTLDVAKEAGVTVIASASIMQGRLARDLPANLAMRLPGLTTDAQRALQFARSAPGVTSALVGMSKVAHVQENLAVAATWPADLTPWLRRRP